MPVSSRYGVLVLSRWVQRFTAVDNSDRSHTRLTTLETGLILPYKYGILPSPHFKQRGSL
jgi:hypothetical protein